MRRRIREGLWREGCVECVCVSSCSCICVSSLLYLYFPLTPPLINPLINLPSRFQSSSFPPVTLPLLSFPSLPSSFPSLHSSSLSFPSLLYPSVILPSLLFPLPLPSLPYLHSLPPVTPGCSRITSLGPPGQWPLLLTTRSSCQSPYALPVRTLITYRPLSTLHPLCQIHLVRTLLTDCMYGFIQYVPFEGHIRFNAVWYSVQEMIVCNTF